MKKPKYLLLPLFAFIAILINSCYYDNEEYLYPVLPAPCDTTNVTYSQSIVNTLSNYCLSCHGVTYQTTGNNLRFDSHDQVAKYISRIIKSLQHDPDYSAMPKNAVKLDNCLINQFIIWKKNGSPNN